jgi:2Fe-2S ferredoxin
MKVTWTTPDGSEVTAEVPAGQTLMEAAVAKGIPEILGDCGGNLSCATCHVFVEDAWLAKTGAVVDFEDAMLDATEVERRPNSRLSCQIEMSATLDGLHLIIPAD